jgi:hypothetical protein
MKNLFSQAILTLTTISPITIFAARPFTVDDAGTVPLSSFEIEVASDYWKQKTAFGKAVKHGITNRMDIGLTMGYTLLPRTVREVSPLEISLKYAFIPQLLSGTITYTASDANWAANLIVSKPISLVMLHGNIGVETVPHEDFAQLTWGIASTVTTGRFTSGIELSGSHERIASWLAGTQVFIFKWLAVDIGITSQFRDIEDFTLTSGFLCAF